MCLHSGHDSLRRLFKLRGKPYPWLLIWLPFHCQTHAQEDHTHLGHTPTGRHMAHTTPNQERLHLLLPPTWDIFMDRLLDPPTLHPLINRHQNRQHHVVRPHPHLLDATAFHQTPTGVALEIERDSPARPHHFSRCTLRTPKLLYYQGNVTISCYGKPPN